MSDDLRGNLDGSRAIIGRGQMSPGKSVGRHYRFQPMTEYEVWNRIYARGLGRSHAEKARLLLGRLRWLEMTPVVLARALEPWPVAMRTLDALHLTSVEFLRAHRQDVKLASYDGRVISAGLRLSIPLFTL